MPIQKTALSYLGVRAPSPPNFQVFKQPPTTSNHKQWKIGDLVLDGSVSAPTVENLYILLGKEKGVANWQPFASGAQALETLTGDSGGAVSTDANDNINILGGTAITTVGTPGNNTITINADGDLATDYTTDAGTAEPSGNNLNVFGSHNLNTSGAGDTVTIADNNAHTLGDLSAIAAGNNALNAQTGDINITAGNLKLPNTNQGGTEGILIIAGSRFAHKFGGANSVYLGTNAGNTNAANTGTRNTGVGWQALIAIESGFDNVAVGQGALNNLTTGSSNTAVGSRGAKMTTGDANTLIGSSAGANYTTSESNNICIGASVGGTAAESNKTRIGVFGTQNAAFIAGAEQSLGVAGTDLFVNTTNGQIGLTTSSRRYKENIQDLEITNFDKLHPVSFTFKYDESQTKNYGLIAEEVAEIFPEMVVFNKEGQAESVRYNQLFAMLIKEVQELKKQVHALQKECE